MGLFFRNSVFRNLLTLLIATVFILDFEKICVAGRRGGSSGGSRSGGSRSSSRSSSSRSSVSSSRTRVDIRVSSSRSHSRPWGYGSGYHYNSWRSYGSAGHIYGYTYYTRSRYHRDYPDREPQICYNSHDYESDNGTEYEYFICPNAEQSEDNHYCCGDDDRQTCCGFWDSGSRVGGVVGGFLAFFFICALCAYFCCYRRSQPAAQPFFQSRILSRRHAPSGCTVQYTVANTGPPVVEVNPPVIGSTMPCGPATQPMYHVSPMKPMSDFNGHPTNENQNLQPMMTGGSADYQGPSVSPPPPYAAVTPYPTVPASYDSGSLPYGDPSASYPGGQAPYPCDPSAPGQSAPYSTSPYPVAPYPTSYTSMPQPEAPPPVFGGYGAPTYPGSAPSYPVSPLPPYNMQ